MVKTYGRRKREEGTVFEGPSPSEIRVPDEALFRERSGVSGLKPWARIQFASSKRKEGLNPRRWTCLTPNLCSSTADFEMEPLQRRRRPSPGWRRDLQNCIPELAARDFRGVVSQFIGGDLKFGRLTVLDELVEEHLATVGDSVDSQVSNPKVDLLRDAVGILGTSKPPLKFAERRRFPPVFHLEVLADLVHDVVSHPMITSQIAKDRF